MKIVINREIGISVTDAKFKTKKGRNEKSEARKTGNWKPLLNEKVSNIDRNCGVL